MKQGLEEAAAAVGVRLDLGGLEKLDALGAWILREAVPAGGIGPREADVIRERHIEDSLSYCAAWPTPPDRCWDLGSGIGLPGLVLAIAWPTTRLTLVDSSRKRTDLARRAARVLDLEVEVLEARIEDLAGGYEAIVSRAAVPAVDLRSDLERLLDSGGLAVVSGGKGRPPAGFERLLVAGRPTRLLMMRAS